ncbi:hypothetical protein [Vacuolonema iberomarrocanum]|uniref:hypothetical protein n=1 Tax=Vacuolonema iberomarrocanum TaxID=3454632 RepID=UPI001A0952C7|nr:hypothetical protein [filamentous cyanobacterium LEGE 07170]
MSDATPAYRGYRLQTLYTLARILEPHEGIDVVFQPEGAEDLAVWETSGSLREFVQVKAYSNDLTLSSLSPNKKDSFLERANTWLNVYPEARVRIASFGDIGSELLQATEEDGQERQRVAQKIGEYGFLSEANSRQLLNQLQIISVAEQELEERVFATLQDLCTGIDPGPAFEMLNFWLYICAEKKSKLTLSDVIQRINDVGQFIAERNAYHSEWFRAIIPVENREVSTQEREQLLDEFYRGISARYDHILAGVDKPRISKLNEIAQKFKEKQIVIVHGASGQGKTAIAYRYLHDFFPDQWRFQVRLIENRKQALDIATALSGQARALEIPMAVYLDVSPNDIGWDELIKQLSSHKNIQILVTVREEDFRRANISGAEIQFNEVELQLGQAEAEEIYQFLVETSSPNQFLDFEDAWNRFGSNGPLMEFVYLITQGDSLRERLQKQVRRIQNEVRGGQGSQAELELLRLVSVASAFEARLKLRELIRFLQLPSPQRTLEIFEEEYFLRTSEDGTLVGGLHPIRSTILADILTDPICTWADSVSAFLPFIFEQDIGSFLLYAFSRHLPELESLLPTLNNYQPKKWTAIAGVVRALIWLGIKEYVDSNRQLILEAYERVNRGWAIVLDFDVADAMPGLADGLVSSLASSISEEGLTQIRSLRSRQTDKSQIFIRTAAWLSNLAHEAIQPDSESDWAGMAEVLYWVGRLQIPSPILNWLALVDLNATVETLSLEILADVALGLFYSNEVVYRSWLNTNYDILLNRFRRETQTVVWEDDGQNIRAHFVIEVFKPNISLSEAPTSQRDIKKKFLNASMERLRLLRRFFPYCERYGSQGYGHLIWINAEMHDESEKNIPISNFPIQKLIVVNSTFKALVEQDLRPETWETYTQAVLELRRKILQVIQELNQGLTTYFRREQMTKILGGSVESELWMSGKRLFEFSPWLPRCAFDEWGFVTEHVDRDNEPNNSNPYQTQSLALEKYRTYLKELNEYVRTCSNFFNQAEWVLNFHPYFRNGENTKAQEIARNANIDLHQKARCSVINLGDTLKTLPKLQSEFRRFLSSRFDNQDLESLERLEKESFKSLWQSWYFFAFHPSRRFQNSIHDCSQQFNNKVREIRNSIRRELRSISSENLNVSLFSEDVQWEEDKSLWIKVNGENPFEVYEAVEAITKAIRQAINSVYDNELRRYAIEFTWSNFVIVPLVRDKSLDSKAWKFSSILFSAGSNRNLGSWNFVPVDIPSIAFSQLALSTWNHPRLIVGQKLVSLIFQLSLLASHIKDFERLPELDELGSELLQQYIQQVASSLSETLQAVLDVEVEIGNYFNTLTSQEQGNRPHLISAMQLFVELSEQILPTNDCDSDGELKISMNLEEVAEWANRLNVIQQSVSSMYLFWVSDILEEETFISN